MFELENPRTTILGWLTIAAGVVAFFTKLIQGEPVNLDEFLILITAVTGGSAGIAAKDGKNRF